MTSVKFYEVMAETLGVSKARAKEDTARFEEAIKAAVATLGADESIKIADVTFKCVTIPERSGTSGFSGEPWTSPEHNTIRVYVSDSIKELV